MRRALGITVTLGVIALAGWWLILRPGAPLAHRPDQGSVTTQQQMTSSDTQRFESALNSTDLSRQASVMTPDLRAAYLAQGQSLLPTGASIKLLPTTLLVNGNAAHVDASFTSPNGTSSTYTLVLIRTDSHSPWLLANTEGK